VRDCAFNGGLVSLSGTDTAVLGLTNNLFERVPMELYWGGATEHFCNNLFKAGQCVLMNQGTNVWEFRNNLFDRCSLELITDVANSHNGYIDMADRLTPTGTNDVVLTNLNYQAGPLGRYYQPTNSALIDAGSTNADLLGLYHYTTTTNQVKETNSIVDIGYHSVAVDTNGNPVDTDSDGFPDYLEDANGNGAVNSGETDWQSATDVGLRVIITRPKAGVIIP
jgi:hypothetical protein